MNEIIGAVVSIALAIVGVAVLAVIVSRNSNTVGVIDSASRGFSQSLSTALSPVLSSSSGFGGAAPIMY